MIRVRAISQRAEMKGLKSQIVDLERHIEIRKGLGKPTKELEGWLKDWKRDLRKHPQWG